MSYVSAADGVVFLRQCRCDAVPRFRRRRGREGFRAFEVRVCGFVAVRVPRLLFSPLVAGLAYLSFGVFDFGPEDARPGATRAAFGLARDRRLRWRERPRRSRSRCCLRFRTTFVTSPPPPLPLSTGSVPSFGHVVFRAFSPFCDHVSVPITGLFLDRMFRNFLNWSGRARAVFTHYAHDRGVIARLYFFLLFLLFFLAAASGHLPTNLALLRIFFHTVVLPSKICSTVFAFSAIVPAVVAARRSRCSLSACA